MKPNPHAIASLGLCAALAACSSVPAPRLHTLTPPPVASVAVPAQALRLDVLPVLVPPAVDRQEIMLRQGSGEYLLMENERWSAPLADELRAALSTALVRRLGAQDVSGLPSPTGTEVLRLRVAVRGFELLPGRTATLRADWNLDWSGRQGATPLTCSSTLEAAAGSSVDSMVLAQQQLLDTLAGHIERTLRAREANPGAGCAEG